MILLNGETNAVYVQKYALYKLQAVGSKQRMCRIDSREGHVR